MKLYKVLFVGCLVVAACGTDPVIEAEDSGSSAQDAEQVDDSGAIVQDAGNSNSNSNPSDMATPEPDTGEVEVDSGGEPDLGPDMAMDAGADAGSEADVGGSDAGTTCDETGFAVTSSTVATIGTDLFVYEAVEGLESDPNYRLFELAIFPEDGGAIATQTFQFTGESYADCGVCLLAYACTQAGCDTTLMAQSGSVNITDIGIGNGDAFAAEFSDIVFQEVVIDDNTFATTLVPGGLEWCIPSLPASGTNVAN